MANARNRIKRTRVLSQPSDGAKMRRSKRKKSGIASSSSPSSPAGKEVANADRLQSDFSTSSQRAMQGGGVSSKIDARRNPRQSLLPKKGRSSDVAMLYRPSVKNIANVKRVERQQHQSIERSSVSDRMSASTSTHFVPTTFVPSLSSHRQSDLVDQIELSPQSSPKTDLRKRKSENDRHLKLSTKASVSSLSVRNTNSTVLQHNAAGKGSNSTDNVDKNEEGDIALEDLEDDHHNLENTTVHMLFFNDGIQVNYDGSVYVSPAVNATSNTNLVDGPVQNTPQLNAAPPLTPTSIDLVSQLFGGKLSNVHIE